MIDAMSQKTLMKCTLEIYRTEGGITKLIPRVPLFARCLRIVEARVSSWT